MWTGRLRLSCESHLQLQKCELSSWEGCMFLMSKRKKKMKKIAQQLSQLGYRLI